MRRCSGPAPFLAAVLIGIAALGRVAATGLAQEATPEAMEAALPPEAEVAGLGLADWSARSWQ